VSPRPAAVDSDGRPIVAELGRAETPEETAARKAENSRKHRSNQTVLNLVGALLASLAVVAFIFLVVVRPATSQREPVDYLSIAAEAQGTVTATLAAPPLPTGWSANRAEFDDSGSDGIKTWRIGLVTPSTQYIAIDQGVDANASWVATVLDGAPSSGTTTIDGTEWQVYDRRSVSDPGNLAYALVTTVPAADEKSASTIVLSGTAPDDEFATLASAVIKQVAP